MAILAEHSNNDNDQQNFVISSTYLYSLVIQGVDCLHAGVATHGCPSDLVQKLKEDLIAVEDVEKVGQVLESYTTKFGESR